MNTKKTILLASLVGALLGALVVIYLPQKQAKIVSPPTVVKSTTTDKVNHEVLYSKETNLPIVSSDALFHKTYQNLDEMYYDAEIVAEIKVKDQQVFVGEEWTVETLSDIDIIELYKGNLDITNLKIAEIGGPIDLTEEKAKYADKPGDGKEGSSTNIVESTLEGVPVIKKGNYYIVFLKKNYGSETYSPLGSIQGKIKLDKVKMKAVATVEQEILNEDINFFQRDFAGKEISELKSEIKKLEK